MRTLHCLNQLNSVKHLAGDVIELGVAKGTTTFALSYFMLENAKDKILYACDTFSGFPYSEGQLKEGSFNYGNDFKKLQSILKYKNITMVEGLVEETLPSLSDKQFCFAWVDMDLKVPTSFAYKFLEERIVLGGIIGFHDYGFHLCPGIKEVVDNEVDYTKYRKVLNADICIFLQRYKL